VRLLTARISARRRSPVAGLLVLLLGLLVSGAAYAALSPASATSQVGADDIAAGRRLFLVGCASCHGQSGEGVVTKRGTQFGPPLAGVGAAAVDFQVGTGRMPLAQPGPQAAQKEPAYTEEEIAQLAAFVASLGPGPQIPTPEQYDPDTIPASERNAAVVQGGEFFRTNCTACHNFAAEGGAMPQGKHAVNLNDVSPRHIYEAMLTGPQQMPVFSDANLTSEQKREVIAYLLSIREAPKFGGFELGSLGPVSEGLFAWVLGIGGCVAFAIWIATHTTRSMRRGAKS
jgi:ubiquinol-cytochrome c reductase cytochrome c subunit